MHTLHHGDCLDILPTLPPSSVDAIIADPPYGTTACKWDSVIPFDAMWRELKRVIKPRGAIVLFGSQPFTSALVMSWPEGFKYDWVWDKKTSTGGLNAHIQPMRAHESILVFSKETHQYYPQMEEFTPEERRRMSKLVHIRPISSLYRKGVIQSRTKRDGGMKNPRTVIRINGLVSNCSERTVGGKHPTQKPLALMEYLVKTYTNEGDTVLDFTMGSGTTGEACINTGRDFIGIEMDKGYYDIAERRLATAAARMVQMEIAI